jgi:REP element-mobilizing transposase RayT
MSNYRRAFVPGGCWFFTVNLLDRRQTLVVEHIAILRDAVAGTRQCCPTIFMRYGDCHRTTPIFPSVGA